MLKKILIGIVALVAIVLVVAAFMPSTVTVSRTAEIDAPVTNVYPLVNDLTKWEDWSPWKEMDPDMVITYTENTEGAGAAYTWKGEESGAGVMTITDTKENEMIATEVEFEGMGTSVGAWTFEDMDGKTKATWAFTAEMNSPPLLGRLFGPMVESGVGKDFERGLEKLKVIAEGMPKLPEITVNEEMLEERHFVMAEADSVPYDSISAVMGREYGRIGMFLGSEGLEMAGMPMAIWEEAMKGEIHSFACGLPVAEVVEVPEGMMFKTIEGKFLTTVHTGPYDSMDETYEQFFAWLAAKGHSEDGMMWEEYINDPGVVAPEDIQTKIYYAVN